MSGSANPLRRKDVVGRMADLSLAGRATLFGDRLLDASADRVAYRDTTSRQRPGRRLGGRDVMVHGRACRMLAEYLERHVEADIPASPLPSNGLASAGVMALHRVDVDNFLRRAGPATILAARVDTGRAGSAPVGMLDSGDRLDERTLHRLGLRHRALSAAVDHRRVARARAIAVTGREPAAAGLVALGASNADVAQALGLWVDAVKKYRTRVYQTLGVRILMWPATICRPALGHLRIRRRRASNAVLLQDKTLVKEDPPTHQSSIPLLDKFNETQPNLFSKFTSYFLAKIF